MSNQINQPTNQKAKIVTSSIPGPKCQELRQKEDKILAPGLQGFALMAGIVVEKAQGSTVTDVDGNTFLDVIGGIGVNGLGHSHPKFIQAIQRQVEKASVGSFTSPARVELFEKIYEHRPAPQMYKTQLYSSGAEAVESAMRLAKAYTGKWEFVSFWGGFHGKTMGALSLMGSEFKNAYGPLVAGSHIVPYANCYRCPFKMEYSSCGLYCAEFAKKQIKMSCSSKGGPAAIILEPMQGTAGNVIPPDDFLPAIKDIAKEFGALLIVDEMITGFGRTGKFWGSQHSGVTPDIMTLGKQFGGGFPISAVLSTEEITRAKPWSDPSGSSSSYGGNP
ncbi:MAG: aminotransferase class III-fold pyridoxal phosphate-dependent enzyme, partial [Pseudomonadota bacterium]